MLNQNTKLLQDSKKSYWPNLIFLIMLASAFLQSCQQKSEVSYKCYVSCIDTVNDIHRVIGSSFANHREGLYNIFDNDEIIETEYYQQDTILYRWSYHNGIMTEKKCYKQGELFESFIVNYDAYQNYLDLNQDVYAYGEPSISNGKAIFRRHCFSCHYIIKGDDFLTDNQDSEKIKLLHLRNSLRKKEGLIEKYPSDSSKHYIMGFMSQNDLDAIIKFVNSQEEIMISPSEKK